jgi:hypothetical protein
MAKVKNPTTFSRYFNIDRARLDELGVLVPTLEIDTNLFIDPMLLKESSHREMRRQAYNEYRHHFEQIIEFLILTNRAEDVAWRSARRLMEFHEIKGTCLGYGAASINGRGFGPELTEKILIVAKEIVDLGIHDPDLFPAMALFEEDIGPDRISDLTTHAIRGALIEFKERILSELRMDGEMFDLRGKEGAFLRSPFIEDEKVPVILVPKDVLRDLPIATDWYLVQDAAYNNQQLRDRVNKHIAHIWAAKSKRKKSELRSKALATRDSFNTLLDVLHEVDPIPYNVNLDPEGLIKWTYIAENFTTRFKLNLSRLRNPKDIDQVYEIVVAIVEQFQQLIENNGLNRELYKSRNKPRHESTAQRLFFCHSL